MPFFKKSEPKPEIKEEKFDIEGLKANQNALLAMKDANIQECEKCHEKYEEIKEKIRIYPNSKKMYITSAKCIFNQIKMLEEKDKLYSHQIKKNQELIGQYEKIKLLSDKIDIVLPVYANMCRQASDIKIKNRVKDKLKDRIDVDESEEEEEEEEIELEDENLDTNLNERYINYI